MNTFTLHLFAADRTEIIESVASFTGEDASGSFGLLAHHDRFMTALTFGLARLALADGSREYLGFPRRTHFKSPGVLYRPPTLVRINTSKVSCFYGYRMKL